MSLTTIIAGPLIDIAKKELLKIGKKVAHEFVDSVAGIKLGEIICYRKEKGYNNLLLFVHGFSGNSAETFGRTPDILMNTSGFDGWDIYSIGYSSDIFPSIGKGLWSANPDISKISLYLKTLLVNQFSDYQRIAFVAHSMGGLAVQRALLDIDDFILRKISHVLLFGTPSAGLKKAYWFRFWNKQINDLNYQSEFIRKLRNDWNEKFKTNSHFKFKTIAGSKDEFVAVESSLIPFDEKFHDIIEGNHINMIKPKDVNDLQHQSFQVILKTLTNENIEYLKGNPEEVNLLLGEYQKIINKYLPNAKNIDIRALTQLVFALECNNRHADAIKVLQEHPRANTDSDTLGIMGGRFKRKYLLDGLQSDLDMAFEYYIKALSLSESNQDHKQIFYHAINLAFLSLVANNNVTEMRRYAQLAYDNCISSMKDMWELATIAEASLYLGDPIEAENYYKKAALLAGTDIRSKQSMYSNAYYGYQSLMASKDKNASFIKMLEEELLETNYFNKSGIIIKFQRIRIVKENYFTMGYDVFVSYARASKAAEAVKIAENLSAKGLNVFYDKTEIQLGGKFPSDLAEALLSSKVAVVFADETYFSKTWCIYEYKVCCAPYYDSVKSGKPSDYLTENILMVLPESGDINTITAAFPAPIRGKNWPASSDMQGVEKMIFTSLSVIASPLSVKLAACSNGAVVALKTGALIPIVQKPFAGAAFTDFAPASVKNAFTGRAEELWEIYYTLELKSKEESYKACVVQGFAGMGKTQLAAEYMWRYAPFAYKGGIVWINAETDDERLRLQYNKILDIFSKGISEKGQTLSDAEEMVLHYFKTAEIAEKILWVIDNLPGTGETDSPKQIADFCPVRDYVSVIVTTRQHGIKTADHVITLKAFTRDAAIEYLTREPVQKNWLEIYEWKKIVNWVGCLPIALRILQIDLADGFISAKDLLQKAYTAESAAAIDEEAETLKEEMHPGFIRSMHDIMNISYDRLKQEPELFSAAHFFSRLAARLVSESFINSFISNKLLAKLSKRGWLQPVQDAGVSERYWSMHRVTGSYLRHKSIQPVEENMALLKWFCKLVDENKITDYEELQPHFRMISTRAAEVFQNTKDEKLSSELTNTCLKTALLHPDEYEIRGLSFMAAQILQSIGTADELVKAYVALYPTITEDGMRRMIHTLGACYTNINAVKFVIQALNDSRDMVRWTALLYLDNFLFTDICLIKLDALMKETNENILENNSISFDQLLNIQSEDILAQFISKTLYYFNNSDYVPHQHLIVSCWKSLVRIFGRNLKAGGFTSEHIENYLWQIIKTNAVVSIRKNSARALALTGNIKYHEMLAMDLYNAVDLKTLQQATENLVAWIQVLEAPGAPVAFFTEDEGDMGLITKFGEAGKRKPDLYHPLCIVLFEPIDQDKFGYLLQTICNDDSSKMALAEVVNENIDNKTNPERCIMIADACIDMIPGFSSPFWWKAGVFMNQNKYPEALDNLSVVIKLTPAFSDAYHYRSHVNQILGNKDAASADLDSYNAMVAENPMKI